MLTVEKAQKDESLRQILTLQKNNLRRNLTEEEIKSQGFVTAEHTFEKLKSINEGENCIVAKHNENIVGYAIALKREFGEGLPIYQALFDEIDKLTYKNIPISSLSYIFVGQLCVHKDFRGMGVVKLMYDFFEQQMRGKYQLIITDISTLNPRSLKAHQKNGFKKVSTFFDPLIDSFWDVVIKEVKSF
jgi:L-amino acid N-acyltransferase YncA